MTREGVGSDFPLPALTQKLGERRGLTGKVDDEEVDDKLSDLKSSKVFLPLEIGMNTINGLFSKSTLSDLDSPRSWHLQRSRSSNSLQSRRESGLLIHWYMDPQGPTHDDMNGQVQGDDDPLL